MKPREIILKALKNEKIPRVPVAIHSGEVWTFNRHGLSLEDVINDSEKQAEIIEETSEEIKSDALWIGSGFHNLIIRALGGKIKFRKRGAPDVQETLFKNASDADKVGINRILDDKGVQALLKTTETLHKKIGSDILIGASGWGPFTLAGALFGVENLMRNIYKDKKAVEYILEFTSEVCYQYLLNFGKSGAEIVSISEPTASGDMISRKQFEEFSLPYLKKVNSKLKNNGVKACLHICGDVTNRLDLIPICEPDFLSIDYKVDIAKAKEVLGSKLPIAGNMNPVAVMQDETPEGVKAICLDCIKKAGNTGFILMPGCDVPQSMPIENFMAMVEAAYNYTY